MKKSILTLVWGFIILSFFSLSCSTKTSTELNDVQKREVTKEIESIIKNFFNPTTLDYKTHTALRANKEGYVMGGDGKILFTNYSGYDEAMKASFSNIQRFLEAEPTAIYVYVLSKDAASCTTEFKSKFLHTSGDTIINNGCWTFVFKNFDGQWKVIQENGTHLRRE